MCVLDTMFFFEIMSISFYLYIYIYIYIYIYVPGFRVGGPPPGRVGSHPPPPAQLPFRSLSPFSPFVSVSLYLLVFASLFLAFLSPSLSLPPPPLRPLSVSVSRSPPRVAYAGMHSHAPSLAFFLPFFLVRALPLSLVRSGPPHPPPTGRGGAQPQGHPTSNKPDPPPHRGGGASEPLEVSHLLGAWC